jgi:hypothetical protein
MWNKPEGNMTMNAIRTSTLRPGYLVSLKTSVVGNVSYRKQDIEPDHLTSQGELQAKWETERTITDPAEHELAVKTRGRCRTIITSVCAASDFGLLCPASAIDRLTAAVQEARDLADVFNRSARLTKIEVWVITGRVADNDVEAVRAINSEVSGLLAQMERGLELLDVSAIRDAANRARNLGSMLSPEASERVKTAIATARSAARRIVKAGEEGVAEVDKAAIARITEARTAFLDISDEPDIMAEPEVIGRGVDLMPETQIGNTHTPTPTPALDLGDIDDDEVIVPLQTPVRVELD